MDDHRVFYKFFYNFHEDMRLIKYYCSEPETLKSGVVCWKVDRSTNLIGHSWEPTVVWESEINLASTLVEALSGLAARIDEKIEWAEGQLELCRAAKDTLALSPLWDKEE